MSNAIVSSRNRVGSGTNSTRAGQVWLRSELPVRSFKPVLPETGRMLADALRDGAFARELGQRPSFFDLDVHGVRFFVHFPPGLPYVYLIATGRVN